MRNRHSWPENDFNKSAKKIAGFGCLMIIINLVLWLASVGLVCYVVLWLLRHFNII